MKRLSSPKQSVSIVVRRILVASKRTVIGCTSRTKKQHELIGSSVSVVKRRMGSTRRFQAEFQWPEQGAEDWRAVAEWGPRVDSVVDARQLCLKREWSLGKGPW